MSISNKLHSLDIPLTRQHQVNVRYSDGSRAWQPDPTVIANMLQFSAATRVNAIKRYWPESGKPCPEKIKAAFAWRKLMRQVKAEMMEEFRRVTGDDNFSDAKLMQLLRTRCSLTRGDIHTMTAEEIVLTLSGVERIEAMPKDSETSTVHKARRRRIRGIKPLTEFQRLAMELYGVHMGKISEIAKAMGITHPTVIQHLKAADKKMPFLHERAHRAAASVKTRRLPEENRWNR